MVSLQSVGAWVCTGLCAATISACTTDNGGDVTGPTPTVSTSTTTTSSSTTTTTVPPTSVPQISHLTANFSSNTCVRQADGLSAMALVVTFDYVDGSGDLAGGHVMLNRVYNTGRSEWHSSPIPSSVTLNGTSTSGQLTIPNACPLFDNATSSTETYTLYDANGMASNSLSITVNRPPGDR